MTTITHDLPSPILAFLTEMNNFNTDGMVSAFADDALVNDVQREIQGAEAIREWVEREVTGGKAVTTKLPAHNDTTTCLYFVSDSTKQTSTRRINHGTHRKTALITGATLSVDGGAAPSPNPPAAARRHSNE